MASIAYGLHQHPGDGVPGHVTRGPRPGTRNVGPKNVGTHNNIYVSIYVLVYIYIYRYYIYSIYIYSYIIYIVILYIYRDI